MRNLIITKGERFNIDFLRGDIEEIVRAFDRYLDEYPVKTVKTMHGLIGPISMILDGARLRKEDLKTLVGKAIRVHEMNPKTQGYLSPSALEALETATAKLLELCRRVPVTAVSKITDRIRYNVYYIRRKKVIEKLEQIRQAFINFLRERYETDTALIQAWGEDGLTFDSLRYPGKREMQQATGRKREDFEAFWALPIAERLMQFEEDEE